MADRTIVGSLLITAQVDGTPFARGMNRMAAITAQQSATMRRSLVPTTASIAALHAQGARPFRTAGFIAATRAFNNVNQRADALKTTLLGLGAVFGGFSFALATNALISYADSYRELQNRIRVTTTSTQEMLAVQEALLGVANRSRSGFRETAILYSRMAIAGRELGLSQQQLLDITETIQKAFLVGGSTPIEARQSAIQLSQGIASNRLSGDELRSVLENQALGQLIADQLAGGSIGELRRMAEAGELTARAIMSAFAGAAEEINERFERIVPTIGQAFVVLDNAFTNYIGKQDSALGISDAFIKGIMALARNIDVVVNSLVLLGGVLVTNFVTRGITPAITGTIKFIGQTRALRLAAVAQTLAMKESALALQADAAAKLRNAQAGLTAARAGAALGATTAQMTRTVALAQVEYSRATLAATSATGAFNAALAATRRTAIATTTVMAGLSRLMALFGGPLNFAITAAVVGFGVLATRQSAAAIAAAQHADELENLRAKALAAAGASDELQRQLREEVDAMYARSRLQLIALQMERDNIIAELQGMLDSESGWERVMGAGGAFLMSPRLNELTAQIREAETHVQNMAEAMTFVTETLDTGVADLDSGLGGAADNAEKIAKAIAELRMQARAGPLDEFNRSVAEAARQAGFAEEAVMRFIAAVESGDFSGVDSRILDMRTLMQINDAWEAYHEIMKSVGPSLAEVSQKQAQLNYLVMQGAITSAQARLAFVEYMTGFDQYAWINETAEAFTEFAKSAITDFENVGDAWETLVDRMRDMVLQELILTPFQNALKMMLGGLAAAFGGGFGGMGSYGLPGVFHDGGRVGAPGAFRMVDPAVFDHAPRFHRGLGGDEFAAILQRGERVLTERQQGVIGGLLGALGGRRGTIKVMIENSGQPKEAEGEATERSDGGIDLIIRMIDQVTAQKIGSPGSRTNQALRKHFTTRPRLTGR